MSGEIVCSFVELDVLGVALRLDVRQFPFSIPHFAKRTYNGPHWLAERYTVHQLRPYGPCGRLSGQVDLKPLRFPR